jgi:hypothetical protein
MAEWQMDFVTAGINFPACFFDEAGAACLLHG